ncbi:hypothetical protein O181_001912 [Austropuccinia psidii MF-1]|uniref:Uncharacterized protein n=1 Tax=Austropuccinia psidii MF-1 TaxID=1389203 RepID=A0A9Q3BBS2_9BASI|nr:hypothetical protein [Austropuccinia psidii MF-1]
MDLIQVKDAKIQKPKPSRGKGYAAGLSCITNILIHNKEAKINLASGAFCTCVGKDHLDRISTNWKEELIPIEAAMIFPHHTGSIILKAEFVMNNCTSQHFILGNDYLNIDSIYINNHNDRYSTIGENKRQKSVFTSEKREITAIRQVRDFNKGKLMKDTFIEAKMSPELTLKIKEDLIEILFQNREAFASDNEPLGDIKGHEVDIMLNVERN